MASDHLHRLWDFIQRDGVIDDETHDHLIHNTGKAWQPLGRVLIDLGYLKVKDLMHLLALQADEPSAYLGSLATREGYCTPEQIDRALELQRHSTGSVYEYLTRDRGLPPQRLFEAAASYIRHLETLITVLQPADASSVEA